jgi:hypothetical protein
MVMMREGDLGVEVLVAFGFNKVGQVIYPPGVLRERMIKGGLVKPVAAKSRLKEVFSLKKAK